MDSEVQPKLTVSPFDVGGGLSGLSLEVPSDLSRIEEAVELVSLHCVKLGLKRRTASFNLRVALSEALANAIMYGNKLDSHKSVNVTAEASGEKISVKVEDQGSGYDPTCVPDPTTPERIELPDGRGLFLIRNLVDEVTFSERGNAICMVLRRS